MTRPPRAPTSCSTRGSARCGSSGRTARGSGLGSGRPGASGHYMERLWWSGWFCTPNGLGDLFLNLKDPTGTIGASVHKKVITDGNLGKGISVESVIVLKQVLPEVSASPSKRVISSSTTESQLPAKCAETGRSRRYNHMERRSGTETSEGTAAILSKISSTRDSRVAEVLSDNSGAGANAVHSSILRMDRGTIHGVESHHEIRLEEMDSSPPRKNVPSYNTSQQLQKFFNTINTMNPANWQQRHGGSRPKYGRTSEAESSTSNIMRLLGGETKMPSSKEITVAEVSRDIRGTPDASNSTSRMDVDARCSSEKYQEIGLKKFVGRPLPQACIKPQY